MCKDLLPESRALRLVCHLCPWASALHVFALINSAPPPPCPASPQVGGSASFGFTWVLPCFSERSGVAASPWVTVGGQQVRRAAAAPCRGQGGVGEWVW